VKPERCGFALHRAQWNHFDRTKAVIHGNRRKTRAIVVPVKSSAGGGVCRCRGIAAFVALGTLSGAAWADTQARFDIDEFRVNGNTVLPVRDIETATYGFLGPARTADDVEKARAALENLYQKRGYPTVTVEIPRQDPSGGIVRIDVTERRIGRLRVTNAHYFEPDAIRDAAPSLAPGTVPNIDDVQRDMRALNLWPGRAVAPELRAGQDPGTMDVDLQVTDRLPLHGSLELNNRRSADTTPLRLVGSLGYDNLWQKGDSIGLFFQVAPDNTADALVYSATYTFRIPGTGLAVVASYVKSDSNVTSVGGTNVVGKGQIAGLRLQVPLPGPRSGAAGFSHDLSAGFDYKDFDQRLTLSSAANEVPLIYYPGAVTYEANWTSETSHTELSASTVFGTPGLGSSVAVLESNRAFASSHFIYLKGSVAHTHELPWGMQFWARAVGQATTNSLVPNEQFNAGGADTVRGYLEAEVLGDNGAGIQTELRSPSFAEAIGPRVNELRVHLFLDAAETELNQPLPEQRRSYGLGSAGIGVRARVADHATAVLDNAYTLGDALSTKQHSDVVLFRLIGDF
jgi:hemolysin activation/secretion protein